ncbi:MAG: hypothetical protein H6581_00685 [Bacteroidia bacterium]|nr:hypothetical protein [Bacteroidia bacterium]
MGKFFFEEKHLARLVQANFFPQTNDEMIFFGLRGATPTETENHELSNGHWLESKEIDLLDLTKEHELKCTIGQWKPKEGKIAVYPGSTVPFGEYVSSFAKTGKPAVNLLLSGCYKYIKGNHPMSLTRDWNGQKLDSTMKAFRLSSPSVPILRSRDDAVFEATDDYEFMNPGDNIHAAYCNHDGKNSGGKYIHESHGCQVVAGYPYTQYHHTRWSWWDERGPWATFRQRGYEMAQNQFYYMLFNGNEAEMITKLDGQKVQGRLRFGSRDTAQYKTVSDLQNKLNANKALPGQPTINGIDGVFGMGVMKALKFWQDHNLTLNAAAIDRIVGAQTAERLGLELPYF